MREFLTVEEFRIFEELKKFARTTQNLDGKRYVTIVVPMFLWDRVEQVMPTPDKFGPRKTIDEETERMVQEFAIRNPGSYVSRLENLRLVRMEARQTAIINYLQKLYDRGVLAR